MRETCLLERFDLFADHGEPGHIPPKFINRVGGSGRSSGVRSASRRCGALRNLGLNPRIPSHARIAFMRLMIRVRSPTRLSRSRLGRLASSFSSVGIATIPQCPRSPRSQPRKTRISIAVSNRSVFARRCSRDTATLVEWMTCTSIPRACSHRASQKPSRPAAKASAIRSILLPAMTASSRQRSTSRSNASGLGPSFFRAGDQRREPFQPPASSPRSFQRPL